MPRRKTAKFRAVARAAPIVNAASRGNVDAAGNLRVDATVMGPIAHDRDVTVESKGTVIGTIRARTIVVAGKVSGDLYATKSIIVTATGNVRGDLHAPRIAVLTGACIRGRIVMRHRPEHEKELDEAEAQQLLLGTNRY
jgi:cytoskeletal protein CcmA (bactofilin family)